MVTLDPSPGLEAAARHLAELGHRRICWLGIEIDGQEQVVDRKEIFTKTARNLNLEVRPFILPTGSGPKSLVRIQCYYEMVTRSWPELEKTLGQCTAVLCYNDELAIALSYVLREHGRRLPKDLSLVGFDDLLSDFSVPSLTSISHGFPAMAQEAVQTVIRMAQNPADTRELQGQTLRVPSELVIRRSTTAPGVDP